MEALVVSQETKAGGEAINWGQAAAGLQGAGPGGREPGGPGQQGSGGPEAQQHCAASQGC